MLDTFFENAEIFVTGGSGVVGKALIELFLHNCNVRRIYVLLRPKKGADADQRLQKMTNHKLFRRLRVVKPNELSKLTAIPGDALMPNLGITPESARLLENVSFVYHCAATVRFDEPLIDALKLNVGGTLEALKFAETLQHLKLFMHVSTFFSNPYVLDVEPKIYSSPMDWKFCLNLANKGYNEETLNILTKKLITGFPNTYTFTKNLAESLINDYRHRVPVAIFRPSIVLAAFSHPETGFPPTLQGAMGLFALVGGGILKTVYLHPNVFLDITPQDTCVKIMLFYTLKACEMYSLGSIAEAPVYQFSSRTFSSESFRDIATSMDTHSIWFEYSFEKSFLLPGCHYTDCRFVYMTIVFLKQILPACLVDGILCLCGKKPALMGIVRKAYLTLEVMQPFMFNNYSSRKSSCSEFFSACRGYPKWDVERDFQFEITGDRRLEKCRDMISGLRDVLLHEDPKTIPRMQNIYRVKLFFYYVVRGLLTYYFLRWLYRVLEDTHEINMLKNDYFADPKGSMTLKMKALLPGAD